MSINLCNHFYSYLQTFYVYRYHKQGCITRVQLPVLSSIAFLTFCSFGRLLTAALETHDLLFLACYTLDCLFNSILTIQYVSRRQCRRLRSKTTSISDDSSVNDNDGWAKSWIEITFQIPHQMKVKAVRAEDNFTFRCRCVSCAALKFLRHELIEQKLHWQSTS